MMRRVIVLVLLALLAACAAPTRIGGEAPAFERTGRFAVHLQPLGQAPQAVQGGFAWRDEGQRLVLDLVTPLGSVLARVQVAPAGATLERDDGSRSVAPDADALVAQVWGHPMPVAGLRQWMQGRLAEGAPARDVQRDDAGRLASFEQQGWRVRLQEYDTQGPRRIALQRRDDQGLWRLRLVVDAARSAEHP